MHCMRGHQLQLQARKAPEIVIERTQRCAMLDGDSGEVCIGSEVAGAVGTDHQPRQQCAVTIRGIEYASVGVVEPVIDQAKRVLHSQRVGEDAGLRSQSNEAKYGDPTETDTARFGKRCFQPLSCWGMLRDVAVDGIQQDVDIGCFHWR